MPETMTRITPSFSDIDAAEKAGLTIPPVDPKTGFQKGRLPPAIRKITAQYEAVDLDTATARMKARMKGTMPPIAGGLDGPGTLDMDKARRRFGSKLPDTLPVDVQSDIPEAVAPMEPPVSKQAGANSDAMMQLFIQQLAKAIAPQQQAPLNPFNPEPLPAPAAPASVVSTNTPAANYLARRTRVGFTVSGGTYSVPAVDVKTCAAGLVILLPVDKESATFVPGLGAEVVIEYEDKRWNCFFPGVAVVLDALGLQVLSFVYQDDKQAV